jgi:hypothetical protein
VGARGFRCVGGFGGFWVVWVVVGGVVCACAWVKHGGKSENGRVIEGKKMDKELTVRLRLTSPADTSHNFNPIQQANPIACASA